MSVRDSAHRYDLEQMSYALGTGKDPLARVMSQDSIKMDETPSLFIRHKDGNIKQQIRDIIEYKENNDEHTYVYEQLLLDYENWWLNNHQNKIRNPQNQIPINPLKMSGDLNQLAEAYKHIKEKLPRNTERLNELTKRAVIKNALDLDTVLRNIRYETGIHIKDFNEIDESIYPYSSIRLNSNNISEGFTTNKDSFGIYKEGDTMFAFSKNEIYLLLDGELKAAFKSRGNMIDQSSPIQDTRDYYDVHFNNFNSEEGDNFVEPALNLIDLLSRYSRKNYNSIISSPLRNPILILDNETRDHVFNSEYYTNKSNEFVQNCLTLDGIKEWFEYHGKEGDFAEFKELYESESNNVKTLLHIGMRQGIIKDPIRSLKRGNELGYKEKKYLNQIEASELEFQIFREEEELDDDLKEIDQIYKNLPEELWER